MTVPRARIIESESAVSLIEPGRQPVGNDSLAPAARVSDVVQNTDFKLKFKFNQAASKPQWQAADSLELEPGPGHRDRHSDQHCQ